MSRGLTVTGRVPSSEFPAAVGSTGARVSDESLNTLNNLSGWNHSSGPLTGNDVLEQKGLKNFGSVSYSQKTSSYSSHSIFPLHIAEDTVKRYNFLVEPLIEIPLVQVHQSYNSAQAAATANNSIHGISGNSNRKSSKESRNSESTDRQFSSDGDQSFMLSDILGSMWKPFSRFFPFPCVSKGRGSRFSMKQILAQSAHWSVQLLTFLLLLHLLPCPSAVAVSDAGGGSHNAAIHHPDEENSAKNPQRWFEPFMDDGNTGRESFIHPVLKFVEEYEILYRTVAFIFILCMIYLWFCRRRNDGIQGGQNEPDDDEDLDDDDSDDDDNDDNNDDDNDDGIEQTWIIPIAESHFPNIHYPGFMDLMAVQQEVCVPDSPSQQVLTFLPHKNSDIASYLFSLPRVSTHTTPIQVASLSTIAFYHHSSNRPSLIFPESGCPLDSHGTTTEPPVSFASDPTRKEDEFLNSFSPSWPMEISSTATIPIARRKDSVILGKRDLYNAPATSPILVCDSSGLVSPLKNEKVDTREMEGTDEVFETGDNRASMGEASEIDRVVTSNSQEVSMHYTSAALVGLAVRVSKTLVPSACFCVGSSSTSDNKQSDLTEAAEHSSPPHSAFGSSADSKDVVIFSSGGLLVVNSLVGIQQEVYLDVEPLEVLSNSNCTSDLSLSTNTLFQDDKQKYPDITSRKGLAFHSQYGNDTN